MKKLLFVSICVIGAFASNAQISKPLITQIYKQQVQQYGLSNADAENFVITDQYTDARNGVTHVYLRQVVNGIELFNANSSIHFKNQQVVSISIGFVPNAVDKILSEEASIGTSQAIQIAGSEAEVTVTEVLSKADIMLTRHNPEVEIIEPLVSEEPIRTKLYYLNTEKGLVLSYNVELYNNKTHDWWNIRIDANSGNVVEKNNWTTTCSVSSQTFTDEKSAIHTHQLLAPTQLSKKATTATSSYYVYPYPTESPNHGPREFVSGSIAKLNASPYGWHDIDGNEGADYLTTKGNNVFADEDTLARNGTGYSPDGGDSLVFDFPMDSNWLDYKLYLDASITQLFYANNVVHDIFYQYGFDEVSGNFQYNNYGKGGADSDYVNADAMDGSGTGNAVFISPPDGKNGRMQMYLWPTTASSPSLTISGSAIANGNYTAPLFAFGAKYFENITAEVVLVSDGTSADSLGCDTLVNTGDLTGKIALIYRGSCELSNKVLNAQNAGAIAVIMIQTEISPNVLQGNNTVVIPSVIVSQADGAKIRNGLNKGDTVMAALKGLPIVKAYDSDFDNGVIAHEFGHGVSIRLTGGPSNSNCLTNAEQAGEGWSDFFALALTAKVGDQGTDAKGIGTFVKNQPITAGGMREYRYSTNITTNPMTYAYAKSNKGVHYTGTVWCTMLWEMYWALVDKYGFDGDVYNGTGGNNRAIQLVIDGLKLQPCGPGFVDARNAILKADSINNGGADRAVIWKAFAKRGLGFSANQGLATSITDGTAAFDLPPDLNTGMSSLEDLSKYISVKPNPTSGVALLILPDQLTEMMITITDVAGKVVLSGNMATDMNQHIQLDLSENANGIYFVKVINGATSFQSKIVLAK